ncbi:hypothetical protein HII36_38015 [Nonomuraea sp. NN258]|uniref:hypothetical protein n=1 Tax=Nonomuraea antri TaxID=2730852 RepID=UPI001568E197|nr:hypothetical protein [Nonomuraea antri]NRQ37587.1 hypothetical protein [Nonomuraea antri]
MNNKPFIRLTGLVGTGLLVIAFIVSGPSAGATADTTAPAPVSTQGPDMCCGSWP